MPAPLIGLAVGAAARLAAKKAAQAGAKKAAKKANAKFIKESASKVKLNPEPSSMKVVATKFDMGKAAKAEKLIANKRAAEAKATSSKKALKAANKPLKSKAAIEAREASKVRAKKTVANFKADTKAGKKVKDLSPAQKYAFRRSLE
jgi:hypothetical protein